MDKAENAGEHDAGDTFLGHSGWEPQRDLVGESSSKKVLLSSGIFVAALLIFSVVFLKIPSAKQYSFQHPIAIRCTDNSHCAANGLLGDCCPTPKGDKLSCCTASDNFVTPTLTAVGACDDNSACLAAGLLGACCPTSNGIHLACCTSPDNKVSSPRPVSAQCSANPACVDLPGNCCPNDDGVSLGCCPPTSSHSSASSSSSSTQKSHTTHK